MPRDVDDGWSDRRRVREDKYFRKRDQELIEQARLQAEDEAAVQRLAEAAGVCEEDILQDLQRLGYTAETVALLHVVPLIEVAWADGTVSEPERDAIVGHRGRLRRWAGLGVASMPCEQRDRRDSAYQPEHGRNASCPHHGKARCAQRGRNRPVRRPQGDHFMRRLSPDEQ